MKVYRNSKIEHDDVTCYKNKEPLTMVVERLLPTIALFTSSYFGSETNETRPKKYRYATKNENS